MRLINCSTLQLEDFIGRDIPAYAILSHTWGRAEVSFAELNSAAASTKSKDGYKKITFTCEQAIEDNLQYAWVDTCCIDKSSSAELSEAINSMFQWYQRSTVCYAYLSDVTLEEFQTEFVPSRWFTRSWTLQELLAPDHVTFFDQSWKRLGTKIKHAAWISQFTRIDEEALSGYGDDYSFDLVCAARRMSWASHREASRVEDAAYALLGIFYINMPLLYSEGSMAFIRLQEEIFKRSGDQSLLAW
ncbi:heterokaryon incompatibility protein-domain-containing protein, partial [Leptodontidium sp. 2 PMI_412]